MDKLLIGFLTDPGVIGVVLAVVFGLVAMLLREKSKVKKVLELAFLAFGAVEKLIPDNVSNASLSKADKALKIFVGLYSDAFGKEPPDNVVSLVQGLWASWARQHKVLAASVK